jgi:hypothetical protein
MLPYTNMPAHADMQAMPAVYPLLFLKQFFYDD